MAAATCREIVGLAKFRGWTRCRKNKLDLQVVGFQGGTEGCGGQTQSDGQAGSGESSAATRCRSVVSPECGATQPEQRPRRLLQSCQAAAQIISISRQGDEATEAAARERPGTQTHRGRCWIRGGPGWTGERKEMGQSDAASWAIVTLFFARWVQQADGLGARRVCDGSDDDGARRQSGNTSGDGLLAGDERVSASLGAARQSAMVGSSATRLFCGGDALFSGSCSRSSGQA
ncbi:hypothetical protein MKX08_000715 [Trichoderma sp. CBMAI-0020]|nr:hypothetical protein MKX08_000715 [Trichoderma sp. CBMAI-0020]